MRTHLTVCALVLLALAVRAPAQGKVGETAPALAVKSWIGRPLPGFAKGRVAVVEFWAPWCGPCVAAFPHLNALVEEAKGLPVDFVSVTDEPEAKVRAFLRTRPLKTRVAIDQGGKSFAAYGASVIPHTALVGPDGRIVAVTRPEAVTAAALRAVLAGQDPKLPTVVDVEGDVHWDEKAGLSPGTALSLAVLRPSPATSGLYRPDPKAGRIVADGIGISEVVKLAYDADSDRVRGDLPKVSTPLRLSVKAPDGSLDTARAMLRDLVERTFGLTARWEEVERTVPVLRRTAGPLGLKAAAGGAPGGEARMGHIVGKGQPSSYLALMAGTFSEGEKALDETGLAGLYDVDLEWTPSDRKSFDAALARLGLAIVKAPRKVRELVVARKG